MSQQTNRDLDEAEEEAEYRRATAAAAKFKPVPARSTKKASDTFVQLPLWFARAAAKATNTRKALVWIWLVRLAFEHHSLEFPVPNGRLRQMGVSRTIKDRTLREME